MGFNKQCHRLDTSKISIDKHSTMAPEMDFWRRSGRVTRIDSITNKEIIRLMKVEKHTLTYIEEKLIRYEHVNRSNTNRWIYKMTDWSSSGERKIVI